MKEFHYLQCVGNILEQKNKILERVEQDQVDLFSRNDEQIKIDHSDFSKLVQHRFVSLLQKIERIRLTGVDYRLIENTKLAELLTNFEERSRLISAAIFSNGSPIIHSIIIQGRVNFNTSGPSWNVPIRSWNISR